MKAKPERAWCIKSERMNCLMPRTFPYKRDCINDFLSRGDLTWDEAQAKGWRCVLVEITEVSDD